MTKKKEVRRVSDEEYNKLLEDGKNLKKDKKPENIIEYIGQVLE